jgi:protein involved in polysaccharide export with SLBB domain
MRYFFALLLLPFSLLEAQTPAPTLMPGDALQITVWREADLSGEFIVAEDGTVTLPLLGRRTVAGVSLTDLQSQLLTAYGEQLRNPSVVITPLRRVYVLGEVHRPGLQSVDPTVSLAGVIALAGGANAQGDLRRIRIVRDGEVIAQRMGATQALSTIDVRSGDQIFVERRSWFDRNSTFVVSALLSGASIVIALMR